MCRNSQAVEFETVQLSGVQRPGDLIPIIWLGQVKRPSLLLLSLPIVKVIGDQMICICEFVFSFKIPRLMRRKMGGQEDGTWDIMKKRRRKREKSLLLMDQLCF